MSQAHMDIDDTSIEKVANDDLTRKDMMSVIQGFLDEYGLVTGINNFNMLMDHGVNEIISQFVVNRVYQNTDGPLEKKKIVSFGLRIHFANATVDKPSYIDHNRINKQILFPNHARRSEHPYFGMLRTDVTIKIAANYEDGTFDEKESNIKQVELGKIPIMVGSNKCHTYGLDKEAKIAIGEDPMDNGGYFIVKGHEYAISNTESSKFNHPHIHKNMMATEHVRVEHISQEDGAFQNSSMVRFKYLTSGAIIVTITNPKFEKLNLPFYILYRLFGMTSDRDIVRTVVGSDLDAKSRIMDIMDNAFTLSGEPKFDDLVYERSQEEIVRRLSKEINAYDMAKNIKDENALQYLNTETLQVFDNLVFPHIGKTSDFRMAKLELVGSIIHNMLLVHLGILEPTDRDHYKNKRLDDPGKQLMKTLKTYINKFVIKPVTSAYRNTLFKKSFWADIDPQTISEKFVRSFESETLTKNMDNGMTSNQAEIRIQGVKVKVRLNSTMIEKKNNSNVVSSLRTITVYSGSSGAAKQTERANDMRQVHPSFVGYVCINQSADTGELVGIRKQLAITALILPSESSITLKRMLVAEPLAQQTFGPTKIIVNGSRVAFTHKPAELLSLYRRKRRRGELSPFLTIYWDTITNSIYFNTDDGRVGRPLLIVDSNVVEYDKASRAGKPIRFVQNTRFTKAHVQKLLSGEWTVTNLVTNGIAEFITIEENENCYLANSIDTLRRDRHNVLRQYTHVDIEQAVMGILALNSTFGNFKQAVRLTYQTNHAKQVCGVYQNNSSKDAKPQLRFLASYVSQPIVFSSTSQKYLMPNGGMLIIAMMSGYGDNMEDSLIANEGSAKRNLLAGIMYTSEKVELDKDEIFMRPDHAVTKGMRANGNYDKLVGCAIAKGVKIEYGDVLIGKVKQLKKPVGKFIYEDRSVLYLKHDPVYVESVQNIIDKNDGIFYVVKMVDYRNLRIGDKLSNRSGNKGVISKLWPESEMPYTAMGLRPDLMYNPHSIPSRMIVNQLVEMLVTGTSAHYGMCYDGMSHLEHDHDVIASKLIGVMARYTMEQVLYHPKTGMPMNATITCVPMYEFRLLKFACDQIQCIGLDTKKDLMTGQPLKTKHLKTAKIGEMEGDVYAQHGIMVNLNEKVCDHSDGLDMFVCQTCGNIASYNDGKVDQSQYMYSCNVCKEAAVIGKVNTKKTTVQLLNILAGSHISVKMFPENTA